MEIVPSIFWTHYRALSKLQYTLYRRTAIKEGQCCYKHRRDTQLQTHTHTHILVLLCLWGPLITLFIFHLLTLNSTFKRMPQPKPWPRENLNYVSCSLMNTKCMWKCPQTHTSWKTERRTEREARKWLCSLAEGNVNGSSFLFNIITQSGENYSHMIKSQERAWGWWSNQAAHEHLEAKWCKDSNANTSILLSRFLPLGAWTFHTFRNHPVQLNVGCHLFWINTELNHVINSSEWLMKHLANKHW